MTQRTYRPDPQVLTAFGIHGDEMQALPGGEEQSLLAGLIVLKKVQDPVMSRWAQALLAQAQPDTELRIPQPIPSDQGDWEVDGWIATEFVADLQPLQHDPARIIEVGAQFSDLVANAWQGETFPVRQRQDRWAQADRFVWDEEPIELTAAADEITLRLRRRMTDVAGASTVIHGDLSGNVFVDPAAVPVVLDFSPFIRPKRYASAIVIADNLLWRNGEPALTRLIDNDDDSLARALLFRLASEQLAPTPPHGTDLAGYNRTIDSLGWS